MHLPVPGLPLSGHDGDPPAFNLAQLRVRDVDLQGQPGHPHGDVQGGAQVLVCEVHHRVHLAFHLFAIDKDVVAAVGHLPRQRGDGGGEVPGALETTLLPFVLFSSKARMLDLGSPQCRA